MRERFLLSFFFPCLLGCAALVLYGIWTSDHVRPPLVFQLAATLFVIGLASFLSWFVLVMRKLSQSA